MSQLRRYRLRFQGPPTTLYHLPPLPHHIPPTTTSLHLSPPPATYLHLPPPTTNLPPASYPPTTPTTTSHTLPPPPTPPTTSHRRPASDARPQSRWAEGSTAAGCPASPRGTASIDGATSGGTRRAPSFESPGHAPGHGTHRRTSRRSLALAPALIPHFALPAPGA